MSEPGEWEWRGNSFWELNMPHPYRDEVAVLPHRDGTYELVTGGRGYSYATLEAAKAAGVEAAKRLLESHAAAVEAVLKRLSGEVTV